MNRQRRIGAIVQARMSSRRLPGKSLCPLGGKPMLQYVLESLMQLDELSGTLVATSTDTSDDPIAEFCERFAVPCFRGSLDNVAERFLEAARTHTFAAFVRVSGDSPLLDPRLVTRAIDLFRESDADLATNVFPRTYPAGMSVEVVKTESFERLVPKLSEPDDREHVTSFFYRNAADFQIASFVREVPRRDVHLAVDAPEHFEFVARLVRSMNRPHWDYAVDDILRLCDELQVSGMRSPSQVRP
ncbi:MAG TPA: NTP transferase domain-containing protein [Planctomycetaceae bacterium]|nr:NTP transferase domain-containing protein [Planctomycetaceae bacterium]